MATISEKQLGQVRNGTGGTAESIYSPAASTIGIIKSIVVCENSGNADSFSIYLDDNGGVEDETTCLFKDVALAANETIILNVYWPMDDVDGNLAVEAATTARVTFTVFGLEIT
jgi:hypothetical protein